jgi:hypothetical protein
LQPFVQHVIIPLSSDKLDWTLMLLMLALLQTAVPLPPLPRQWAQFSRAGALNHITETVEMAMADGGTGDTFHYKLRLTKRSIQSNEVWFAESKNCPVVRDVVKSMADIKMPVLSPFGIPGKSVVSMFDGTNYSISAPTSDIAGEVTLSSNVRSSIAIWIDASFIKLTPCWKKANL